MNKDEELAENIEKDEKKPIIYINNTNNNIKPFKTTVDKNLTFDEYEKDGDYDEDEDEEYTESESSESSEIDNEKSESSENFSEKSIDKLTEGNNVHEEFNDLIEEVNDINEELLYLNDSEENYSDVVESNYIHDNEKSNNFNNIQNKKTSLMLRRKRKSNTKLLLG